MVLVCVCARVCGVGSVRRARRFGGEGGGGRQEELSPGEKKSERPLSLVRPQTQTHNRTIARHTPKHQRNRHTSTAGESETRTETARRARTSKSSLSSAPPSRHRQKLVRARRRESSALFSHHRPAGPALPGRRQQAPWRFTTRACESQSTAPSCSAAADDALTADDGTRPPKPKPNQHRLLVLAFMFSTGVLLQLLVSD